MELALAIGGLLVAAAGLAGWGSLVEHLCGKRGANAPLRVALGIGAVLALGGVLNCAGLVSRLTLAGIIVAGLAFLGWLGLHQEGRSTVDGSFDAPGRWRRRAEAVVVAALVLGVIGFTIWTQFPPRAMNFHDDFQK